MPPEGAPLLRHDQLLTFEEICRIVGVGASLGITKIRLTGGEPLVRKGIGELVRYVAETPGVDTVTMTTNGVLLPQHARVLRRNGLSRLNISLDTLRADRYRKITRLGEIETVFDGIEAALSVVSKLLH